MTDTQADLVERLETEVKVCEKKGWYSTAAFLRDCKAELERLRASNKQMRKALEVTSDELESGAHRTRNIHALLSRDLESALRFARAAIKDAPNAS